MNEHILTWLIFIPTIGAFALLFVPSKKEEVIKTIAGIATFIPLLLAVFMLKEYDIHESQMQFVVHKPWITLNILQQRFEIHYYLGVDGLSFPMILLTVK